MLTRTLTSNFLPSGTEENNSYIWNPEQIKSLINIQKIFEIYFSGIEVISGKIFINHSINSVSVTVPFWLKNSIKSLNNNSINIFGAHLAEIIESPVELKFLPIMTPYIDANILANFLAYELENSTFRATILDIFSNIGPLENRHNYFSHPGALVGVKIRLGGRLLNEASRPRQTIQTASLGVFTLNNKYSIQAGSYSLKNQKGTLTVKVWLCVKI